MDEKRPSTKMEPSFENEKMTFGQGAKFIDVSYPTLCKWINENKIPVHVKGRTRFFVQIRTN